MALDVETPTPPDLTNRGLPADVDPDEAGGDEADRYREAVEDVLLDGAWEEAFNEWAAYADLSEAEYRTVNDAGLFTALDFYWDPAEERLRAEVPPPPDAWADGGEFAARVTAELTDLADTVLELLESTYGDWSEVGPDDDVWAGQFEDETSGE
ncbi:hypothetical protein [Salinigranum halophilum]|jgi:hypothetical protein|uniref:hypothetical protein n=1 Tax=Salinigranum halophilum TaxID=2565931 RepID=UPI00115E263B|nr:hypothetical protein [Salinigranum halophilum]